jgi:hypothetical protein
MLKRCRKGTFRKREIDQSSNRYDKCIEAGFEKFSRKKIRIIGGIRGCRNGFSNFIHRGWNKSIERRRRIWRNKIRIRKR